MRIAIDISPLTTGHFLQHRVRGTGFYVENLRKSLEKYFPEHTYIYFSRGQKLQSEVDVIHIPYFEPFFLTIPVRMRAKTVITIHDLTPLVFPSHFPAGVRGNARWSIQKRLLRRASAIIADSEASKNDIGRFTGINIDKISTVYLAAGEEFKVKAVDKENVIKKFNIPENFVLYVGDVTWNKNLPRLIEACVLAKIPLVIVGKAIQSKGYDKKNPWNKDLGRAQDLIAKNKIIITLGFVDQNDLVDLYNSATLFAMPSRYEGFGLPLLEAMNCGVPVITSANGSISEVVGDAAYIVDSKNMENISQGISKVFHDKELRNELQKKGLTQAARFSWRKTAQETNRVYEKIAASR